MILEDYILVEGSDFGSCFGRKGNWVKLKAYAFNCFLPLDLSSRVMEEINSDGRVIPFLILTTVLLWPCYTFFNFDYGVVVLYQTKKLNKPTVLLCFTIKF